MGPRSSQRPSPASEGGSNLFEQFLSDAEAELRHLHHLDHQALAAIAVETTSPAPHARHALRDKIAEQRCLVEKMRAYVARPGN
ncbi:hypothetical protein CDQ92_07665 [Sphingopyxis bauzanensis]|uniref:Uncharacterized protein n=2 Tax=Sphingopyxis bauzanensis TaxID=651663 RepID=A0A246JV77_9SPHN|nr:hypothetical protein CDQ92_07665 [Sphingopyxis bauzanensis]